MSSQINNQAFLTFNHGSTGNVGTASSNIAKATLEGPFSATKSSLDTTFKKGDEITYMLTLTNNSSSSLSNVEMVDNLGTHTIGSTQVTPLTYTGPNHCYVNGEYVSELSPTIAPNSVTFSIPTVGAGDKAMVMFKATVNEKAQLNAGSKIINEATFTATGVSTPVKDNNQIIVENYASVVIKKRMEPSSVMQGSTLSYIFDIDNYGNTHATNVVLKDAFDPAPTAITVKVAGVTVDPADYDYTAGVLTLPNTGSSFSITLPPATFSQDSTTGEVTITPQTAQIVVSGTV